MSLTDNSGNLNSFQKEFSVKVFDESVQIIEASNKFVSFFNDRFNENGVEGFKTYGKTKDSIYGSRNVTYKRMQRYEVSSLEINRITGDISYNQSSLTKATDDYKEKSYSTRFTGKCKKKERAF